MLVVGDVGLAIGVFFAFVFDDDDDDALVAVEVAAFDCAVNGEGDVDPFVGCCPTAPISFTSIIIYK